MKKGKLKTYYQNPYYDCVFGSFDIVVPSKRISYEIDKKNRLKKFEIPVGSKDFESKLKSYLLEDLDPRWPFEGNLLFSTIVSFRKRDFKNKDLDNITKSLFDALKGIVFVDDKQITSLVVSKRIYETPGFMIAIKRLKNDEEAIFQPEFYSLKPYD